MDPNAVAGIKTYKIKNKKDPKLKVNCSICGKLVHSISQHTLTKHGKSGFAHQEKRPQ